MNHRSAAIRLRVAAVRVFYDVSGSTVEILATVPKSKADLRVARYTQVPNKAVPLSKLKDDLSRFLREAEKQEMVITRHGQAAVVLVNFQSEDDWSTTAWESARLSVANP